MHSISNLYILNVRARRSQFSPPHNKLLPTHANRSPTNDNSPHFQWISFTNSIDNINMPLAITFGSVGDILNMRFNSGRPYLELEVQHADIMNSSPSSIFSTMTTSG